MLKHSMIPVLFIYVFLTIGLNATAVDVTGDWDFTQSSPRGERTSIIHFEQDGNTLIVTMESRQGGEITGKGTLQENTISWTITRNTQRGDFTMTYSGIVKGDTMSGQTQMGERGAMDWSAVRK